MMYRFPRRSLFWLGGARSPYSSAAASSFCSLPRPVDVRADKMRDPIFASSHCNCNTYYKSFRDFSGVRYISTASVSHSSNTYDHQAEEPLNPFSLADELSVVADRLRSMAVAEMQVPELAAAAEYYFQEGSEGKRFWPNVLLLMATAINLPISAPRHDPWILGLLPPVRTLGLLSIDSRTRQLFIAQILEMLHVASAIQGDVLDARHDVVKWQRFVRNNKTAVLIDNFFQSRASVAPVSLKNTEVVTRLATELEGIVSVGFSRWLRTLAFDDHLSMECYLEVTYFMKLSLFSNSCKAVPHFAGHTNEVAMLAYDYGKNMGLAFQLIDDVLYFTGTPNSIGKGFLSDISPGNIRAPILFAMEEFPQLRSLLDPSNEELVLDYLNKSRGIEKTKELAKKHASLATAAIDSLPETDDTNILKSRRALVELAEWVITRTK